MINPRHKFFQNFHPLEIGGGGGLLKENFEFMQSKNSRVANGIYFRQSMRFKEFRSWKVVSIFFLNFRQFSKILKMFKSAFFSEIMANTLKMNRSKVILRKILFQITSLKF